MFSSKLEKEEKEVSDKIVKNSISNSKEVNEKIKSIITHSCISSESGLYTEGIENITIVLKNKKEKEKDYKMKDYNGNIYYELRKIEILTQEYLKSIKEELTILQGTGKGSLLQLKSKDSKIFIKNISSKESKFLDEFIKSYYKYIKENPNSLLIRLFGHHRIQFSFKELNLLVQENLFIQKPLEIYDLKGSSVGRNATEKEKEKGNFKDLDLYDNKRVFQIGKDLSKDLIKQLILDVKFLESNQIMDYSLLIGVFQIKEDENIKNLLIEQMIYNNNRKFRIVQSEDSSEIYYFGIIDYLTKWSLKKEVAKSYKSLSHDVTQLSTVPPDAYSKRFIHFVENLIQ